MPHEALRFRAGHDKLGYDDLAPISPAARAALEANLRIQPAIGDALLFFHGEDDRMRPLHKMQACYWLARTEAGAPGCRESSAGSGMPTSARGRGSRSTCPTRT